MGKTLNLLLIENSEDDAMSIIHELEHGGYDVDFERCDSADTIKDALSRREWDVILSDHAMPRICAPEALHIVKDSMVETPFMKSVLRRPPVHCGKEAGRRTLRSI